MSTLEELQRNRPIIDKISDFYRSNSTIFTASIIIIIAVFLFYSIDSNFSIIGISLISIIFLCINSFLLWIYNKGKNVPLVIGFLSWAVPVVFFLYSAIYCIREKDSSFTITILLGCLCLINYRLALPYYKKWNISDILLKKIVPFEIIGLIISALQLVIAYPQLQLAYKSVSSDDVTELKECIEQFNSHIESLVFVDIPDSLLNDETKKARVFQKQLYTYSLFLVNADWDGDLTVTSLDVDSVMQTSAFKNNNNIRKDVKLLSDLAYSAASTQKMLEVGQRLQVNFIGTQNFTRALETINNYYNSQVADSLLLSSQVKKSNMLGILKSQDEIISLQTKATKQFEITRKEIERINSNNVLDVHQKAELIKKELDKSRKIYNEYVNSPAILMFIKQMDKMCLDYIAFLNLIQLKYGYNVELDLDKY